MVCQTVNVQLQGQMAKGIAFQRQNLYVCGDFQGTAVAQWLRRCATNRKIAGSISDGIIENFH